MSTTDTIKQRTLPVVIRDATGERTVKVRRLSWKAAKHFYAELAQIVATIFAPGAGAPGSDNSSLVTRHSSLFAMLPSIVKESDTLVASLLTGTTDLTAAELDPLDYGDVLSLLAGALAVNLDDEIKNSCAGVVAQIRAFYAAAPAETQPGTPN